MNDSLMKFKSLVDEQVGKWGTKPARARVPYDLYERLILALQFVPGKDEEESPAMVWDPPMFFGVEVVPEKRDDVVFEPV